jgi:hypothetical protein
VVTASQHGRSQGDASWTYPTSFSGNDGHQKTCGVERVSDKGSEIQHLTKFPGVAGHQWLRPVIPATQEAEISRIMVRSQPRQIVHETLS